MLTVVYDACVLYPSTLRDLLARLAVSGPFSAKLTEQILEEVFTNLAQNRPDLDPSRLRRTRKLVSGALSEAMVAGYEPLIELVRLPDADDRHVLAAAITCEADVIVTFNLRDFPDEQLKPWRLQAISPDDLLLQVLAGDAEPIMEALIWTGFRHPELSNNRDPIDRERVLGIASIFVTQALAVAVGAVFSHTVNYWAFFLMFLNGPVEALVRARWRRKESVTR